ATRRISPATRRISLVTRRISRVGRHTTGAGRENTGAGSRFTCAESRFTRAGRLCRVLPSPVWTAFRYIQEDARICTRGGAGMFGRMWIITLFALLIGPIGCKDD